MADQLYAFSHKEVVEALIKKQGLHEGVWQLYVEFKLGAGNISAEEPSQYHPAAIIPIVKIGLIVAKEPSNLTADAAVVNPRPARRKSK